MAWVSTKASELKVGDRFRVGGGEELVVSRIEHPFLGMDQMAAFIHDTPENWFKQPLPLDTPVEVLVP